MYDGVDYDGTVRLLELAEVPPEFSEEFNSGRCLGLVFRNVISDWYPSPQIQDLQHQQSVDQS
jgi:hypothetical protein